MRDSVFYCSKTNILINQNINWEAVSPLLPRLYPVGGALKATLIVNNSCYAASSGSITAIATGGKSPYTYSWKKNGKPFGGNTYKLENLDAGDYLLELKDSQSCTQYYKVTVKYFSGSNPLSLNIIKIPASPPTPELFQGNVSGGIPPYSYNWSYEMKPSISEPEPPPAEKDVIGLLCSLPLGYITTFQMPTKYFTSSCTLSLTVTDSNGCQISRFPSAKGSDSLTNIESISIDDITIYPNPTTGTLTISNITDATVYIYSPLGIHLKTFGHVFNNEIINIDHLSSGIYFLKIIEDSIVINKKIVFIK